MKKKKLIKKLQRKIERLEAFSEVESRVVALEKDARCKFHNRYGTTEYTFPVFVSETKDEMGNIRRQIHELKDEMSNPKK